MSIHPDEEDRSDRDLSTADTVKKIVMAEQITQDVVKEAQSMGDSPIDATATTTKNSAGNGETPSASTTTNSKPSEAFCATSTTATRTDATQVDGISVSEKVDGDTLTASTVDSGKQQTGAKQAKDQLVNGDSGEHSASEELTSQQALGDASGGSDTDISRPGSVDQAKERSGGHLRSNSVKKPASFKSVSVTKNFLAKSAVSTPAARPGEKVSTAGQTNTSAQQTAKPRLVAKSGSGLGNVPRSSLSKMNGAGSGPDASKVWNKNQPVPPPPPKQFTDEELKQQYGIHLATRLQADEAGKEAKWADIDDDEDDWAPDTVQWMDGTKSTVAAVEDQPPPVDEPKQPVAKETPAETMKRTPSPTTNAQRSSSTSGTKTILKPGVHSLGNSNKSGLVLKGQPEKPTLVAKPSTTAPAKSPWAPLPPVDKVSPVQINPPVQQPSQSRIPSRDSHGFDALPLTPTATKEIAPDDFNRSWRDERGNRELFNSHSGRYEPVNEMRRGSFRDNNFRQPSVLQRPSQDGPAEPSAAFQTSRTSADGPAWGRRRNSSNVSGGSGRRMSIDRRGPDIPPMPINIQRRESQSYSGPDGIAPGTPRQAFSRGTHLSDHSNSVPEQHPSWTQKSSPNVGYAQPASPYGSVASSGNIDAAAPGAPVQIESAVEVQNRLMREKLERARLAKQKEREQEEKEEAERKERLRKKLEAMGMSGEPKSKVKERSPVRSTEKSPQKDKAVPAPVQSPPKPPIPTSEGEVAQYGMMKVHQPHPVKKPSHLDVNLTAPKPLSKHVEGPSKRSPSPVKAPGAEAQPKPAQFAEPTYSQHTLNNFNRENNRNNISQLEQSQAQQSEVEARAAPPGLKPTQPSSAAWSTSLPQQQSRGPWGSNIWGPSLPKDRALGNGTFDSSYNRGQPRPTSQQLPSQSQPGQTASIGLNASLKPSPSQPQVTPDQSYTQQTMYIQPDTNPAQQASVGSKHPGNLHSPGPIAPPAEAGWGNFAAAIRRDDQAMVVKARENFERMGGECLRPELREIYADQQGKQQKTLHTKVSGNATPLANAGVKPEVSQSTIVTSELKAKDETNKSVYINATAVNDTSSSQPAIGQGNHVQPAAQAARPSRFFPRPSEATAQSSTTSDKSDSPPPPETESHPAFTSDSNRPVVKMPKPSPRVRLPPAAAEPVLQSEAPVSMPPRARMGLGARPLALNPEWQARFNGLLGKSTPSAVPTPVAKAPSINQPAVYSKPSSLAVAASSKAPLDVRESMASATVSLPNSVTRKTFADDDSSEVITRVSAGEALLEEREFGSLPTVKLSKVPHLAASEPPMGFPTIRPNSRFHRTLEITTKSSLNTLDGDQNADGIDITIRLANMREPITKTIPRKRGGRKGPSHKPKRNFTPTSGTPNNSQNQRSRKPSNYQGQGQGQGSTSHNSSRPSSGSSGWTNNRSTPPHNSSWSRRAAPVH
ncbi:hypothetical protein K469DRAFT_684919 [Zopfia rhizophila CBS 207.26]|uniref:Uncharacterized protein n=1 Tax=Zopfia rhizophila CBS 207.26 TaxID=1314779 RepID=A0A6A6E8D3_9PEZI|nr:hypothetical protein K469DRAFT_684919 [Zopfia rhizophila CBS 207.26]